MGAYRTDEVAHGRWKPPNVGAAFALDLTQADPNAGWSLLYAVPVLLVAQSTSAAGGATAGAFGVVLLVAWAQIRGVDLQAGNGSATRSDA